jgi:RNA polymerase sigma-70 factor, ECF subfamily
MPSPESNTRRNPGFRAELESCLPMLRIRALKLCLNEIEAQDLVQDTIVRALCFQSSFRPGSNLKAWAGQVLFSVFVTRCRKTRRERRALETFRADPNAWIPSNTTLVPRRLPPRMARALEALDPKFRSVLDLVDLNDMSYREAALVLDVPVGTVMSRLFRARRQLALALGEPVLGALPVAPDVPAVAA